MTGSWLKMTQRVDIRGQKSRIATGKLNLKLWISTREKNVLVPGNPIKISLYIFYVFLYFRGKSSLQNTKISMEPGFWVPYFFPEWLWLSLRFIVTVWSWPQNFFFLNHKLHYITYPGFTRSLRYGHTASTHASCCRVLVGKENSFFPFLQPLIEQSLPITISASKWYMQKINVYKYFFERWKTHWSIQQGKADLNGTFHHSPNENLLYS